MNNNIQRFKLFIPPYFNIFVRVQRQAVRMESSAFRHSNCFTVDLLHILPSVMILDHQQEPAENQEGEVNRPQWRL